MQNTKYIFVYTYDYYFKVQTNSIRFGIIFECPETFFLKKTPDMYERGFCMPKKKDIAI